MSHPSFMIENPKPIPKNRLYNGRNILVWEGKAKIASIDGWVENPRIELAKKKLLQLVGNRELAQEEIFELMKNDPEVKLKELRDDILKNGLREPLTLSYTGKLLDGNRRFFATKYALESLSANDPNRQNLETVEVYVLSENATTDDEQNVLVEENFSPSLKIEWPDYVKAKKIITAEEQGFDIDDIAEKFGWTKSKVRDTLKINEIITDFIAYSISDVDPENGGGLGLGENEAEMIAAKNYQYFNEAKKSFFDPLKADIDFKIQFFKWIHEEKFSSFPEVRVAYRAWKEPEAKAALMQGDPTAAKSAKAILDYNDRIVRSTEEATGRIDSFVRFLRDMKATEIEALPPKAVSNLEEALQLVATMSKATSER